MRLPGTINWKRGTPWLVTFEGDEKKYKKEHILEKFYPIIDEKKELLNSAEPIDWSTEREHVKAALKGYDPLKAKRKEWLENVGMPIHDACEGSPEGRKIFDDWSLPWYVANGLAEDELEKVQHSVWKSLGKNAGPRTLASLYWATGYKKPGQQPAFGPNDLPQAPWIEPSQIANEARNRLESKFETYKHNPSDEPWKALTHISTTMIAMAEDKLEPNIYLSSCDPGIGKTETLIETLSTQLELGNLRDVGALICLGSYREIIRIAEKFDPKDFACYVTDGAVEEIDGKIVDLNRLGLGKKQSNETPILFITQKMYDVRLRDRLFSDAVEFYYNGNTRRIKAWDEAILPGETIELSVDDIAAIPQRLGDSYPELKEQIYQLVGKIRDLTGDTAEVPDLNLHAHEYQIRELFKGGTDGDVTPDMISKLYQVSQRTVNKLKDNNGKIKAISYVEILPKDMLPMLVLDASSRWNKTYQFMSDSRDNIRQLNSAIKNYNNATFHICYKGGGKTSINRNPMKYVEAVAKELNSNDEDQLLIHHINLNMDFKEAVDELIEGNKERIGYLHYGIHAGTNSFADRSRVILAGSQFHDPHFKHALIRLTKQLEPHDKVTAEDLKTIELSQSANVIFQAACRGSIRKSAGDGCQKCDIYLFARREIADLLPIIFPGCLVSPWDH